MRPLISLVMILKNEEATIEKTLHSCAPFIDRFMFRIDDKSTDRTKEILTSALAEAHGQGQIVDGTFENFSQARNAALALETESTFCLMLSGGESLVDGEALVKFCEEHVDDVDGAYDVEVELGANRYPSSRLTRTGSAWRYEGVTHEVLVSPSGVIPTKRVPEAWILHEKHGSSRERWLLDADLLQKEWDRNPTPRTAFYLGQTHECLGDFGKAIQWYEHRIALQGWWEEVYESMFRRAKLRGGDIAELLEVYNYAPHRAEPLYEIGLKYYRQGRYALGLLFAKEAASLPYPKHDRLFVIASYYRWQAWDLVACCAKSDPELALMAAKKALEGNPEDARLMKNVAELSRETSSTPR
jgi:glycosyltransferase involved in cell wall biosynthesis